MIRNRFFTVKAHFSPTPLLTGRTWLMLFSRRLQFCMKPCAVSFSPACNAQWGHIWCDWWKQCTQEVCVRELILVLHDTCSEDCSGIICETPQFCQWSWSCSQHKVSKIDMYGVYVQNVKRVSSLMCFLCLTLVFLKEPLPSLLSDLNLPWSSEIPFRF